MVWYNPFKLIGSVAVAVDNDDLVAFKHGCPTAADQFEALVTPQFLDSGQHQIADFRNNSPAEELEVTILVDPAGGVSPLRLFQACPWQGLQMQCHQSPNLLIPS